MNYTIASETAHSSLFSKVALLLSLSFLNSALGSWVGADITSTGAVIVLAILFLAGAFVVPFAAAASTSAGFVALSAWTFISGLFLGPVLHMYVVDLGWETVFLTYLGTGGVMAACGIVGIFSGFNFNRIGGWLLIALLALIIVGVVNIFVPFSHGVNILYCLIGMAVFALFFMFDFFRAAHTENTWMGAFMVTMNLYLDFINFLLYALRLIKELKR